MKKLFFLLVALACLAPQIVFAQPSDRTLHYSGDITGQVKDNAGQAIASARVTGECANIAQCEHFTYYADTDASGNYKIDWLPFLGTVDSADFKLTVAKTGYVDATTNITVTHLQPLSHNFTIHADSSILQISVKDSAGKAVSGINVLASTKKDFPTYLTLKTNSDGLAVQTTNADTYYVKTVETDKYVASDVKAITLGAGQVKTADIVVSDKPAATPTVSPNVTPSAPATQVDTPKTDNAAVTATPDDNGQPSAIDTTLQNAIPITDAKAPISYWFYIIGVIALAALSLGLFFLIKKRKMLEK